MVSHSGRPSLQSRGTVMESWWGLYRWRPACRKSHKHDGGLVFFFSETQTTTTRSPPRFLSFPEITRHYRGLQITTRRY